MRRAPAFLSLALLLVLGAATRGSAAASPWRPAGPEATLLRGAAQDAAHALAALTAEWVQPRRSGRIADVTLHGAELEARYGAAMLARLEALSRSELSHQEDLTWSVLHWQAADLVAGLDTYWFESPLLPATSPMRGVMAALPAFPLNTLDETNDYLRYLRELADVFQDVLGKVRGQRTRGIVLPDEQIDRVLPFWERFVSFSPRNPAVPDPERYAALPASEHDAFQRDLRALVDGDLGRRAGRVVDTLRSTLRSVAPNAVGMGQYPGGREAYRVATRQYTTLEITPEEVHEAGLTGVDDINRQMAEVRAQIGFVGTKAEFHEQLRNDPRFYVDEPADFGAALMAYDARIRPHVFDYFLREPEAPYGVRRVNPVMEPSLTYGFYNRPSADDPLGYYNYNGSQLDQRSLLSGAALTYHELVPGHHYQINLASENEALPAFRQGAYFSGYGEGWGEYASSVVAREMGMYDDPYDLYGRLVFDMFFAVRLVVDSGMNYFDWSRPKAMLYMREHTMESVAQIDSETIRYSIRSPGQALAYRMGRQTWLRLRRQAETALGDAFDIRLFHDAVLTTGSLPLVVLEDHVEWWIGQQLNAGD